MRRLTSAPAESTRGPGRAPTGAPAHLRSRGEHSGGQPSAVAAYGSPPLARRAHRRCGNCDQRIRLTSARAESTTRTGRSSASSSAHLRSRGEHLAGAVALDHLVGSPPLARRARAQGRSRLPGGRLTSARAESTALRVPVNRQALAHLRSRGEHAQAPTVTGLPDGSPPLARRAPGRGSCGRCARRLTSARAESTSRARSCGCSSSAHLRSRGEHGSAQAHAGAPDGSPPLARRAPSPRSGHRPRGRLTSARAESTRPAAPRRGPRPAHLRSRGEHLRDLGC